MIICWCNFTIEALESKKWPTSTEAANYIEALIKSSMHLSDKERQKIIFEAADSLLNDQIVPEAVQPGPILSQESLVIQHENERYRQIEAERAQQRQEARERNRNARLQAQNLQRLESLNPRLFRDNQED